MRQLPLPSRSPEREIQNDRAYARAFWELRTTDERLLMLTRASGAYFCNELSLSLSRERNGTKNEERNREDPEKRLFFVVLLLIESLVQRTCRLCETRRVWEIPSSTGNSLSLRESVYSRRLVLQTL